MSHKTTFFILVAFMLTGGLCHAQTIVHVHKTDNTTTTYNIDVSGELQFINNQILITESALTDNTIMLDVDNIRKLTFSTSTASILESQQDNHFTLYPNPAQRSFSINGIGAKPAHVAIYSVAGQLVLQQAYTEGATIDISHLKRGIYFVKIGSQTTKLAIN